MVVRVSVFNIAQLNGETNRGRWSSSPKLFLSDVVIFHFHAIFRIYASHLTISEPFAIPQVWRSREEEFPRDSGRVFSEMYGIVEWRSMVKSRFSNIWNKLPSRTHDQGRLRQRIRNRSTIQHLFQKKQKKLVMLEVEECTCIWLAWFAHFLIYCRHLYFYFFCIVSERLTYMQKGRTLSSFYGHRVCRKEENAVDELELQNTLTKCRS